MHVATVENSDQMLHSGGALFVSVGVFIFITACFGFCGALKQNVCCLIVVSINIELKLTYIYYTVIYTQVQLEIVYGVVTIIVLLFGILAFLLSIWYKNIENPSIWSRLTCSASLD